MRSRFSESSTLERIADKLLVRERAVDLSGVEEGDAALDGGADERDPVLLGRERGNAWLRPMQPSPIAETSRPCPSVRVSIRCPPWGSAWAWPRAPAARRSRARSTGSGGRTS